ncbi:MAG: hypothetical protein ACFHX7_12195 [Pseudomonadota bacterium]
MNKTAAYLINPFLLTQYLVLGIFVSWTNSAVGAAQLATDQFSVETPLGPLGWSAFQAEFESYQATDAEAATYSSVATLVSQVREANQQATSLSGQADKIENSARAAVRSASRDVKNAQRCVDYLQQRVAAATGAADSSEPVLLIDPRSERRLDKGSKDNKKGKGKNNTNRDDTDRILRQFARGDDQRLADCVSADRAAEIASALSGEQTLDPKVQVAEENASLNAQQTMLDSAQATLAEKQADLDAALARSQAIYAQSVALNDSTLPVLQQIKSEITNLPEFMRKVQSKALGDTQPGTTLAAYEQAQTPMQGCGDDGEFPCILPKPAQHKSDIGCDAGDIFSVRNGGECYSCPSGYEAGLDAANPLAIASSGRACVKASSVTFKAATAGKKTPFPWQCKKPDFWDVGNAQCFQCPTGYERTLFHSVTSGKACSKTSSAKYTAASFEKQVGWCGNGQFPVLGENAGCYACPRYYTYNPLKPVTDDQACARSPWQMCNPGNTLLQGRCTAPGTCGEKGQRPCFVWERIPSCNSGLAEDPFKNQCVTTRNLTCNLIVEAIAGLDDLNNRIAQMSEDEANKAIDNIAGARQFMAMISDQKKKSQQIIENTVSQINLSELDRQMQAAYSKKPALITRIADTMKVVKEKEEKLAAMLKNADLICGGDVAAIDKELAEIGVDLTQIVAGGTQTRPQTDTLDNILAFFVPRAYADNNLAKPTLELGISFDLPSSSKFFGDDSSVKAEAGSSIGISFVRDFSDPEGFWVYFNYGSAVSIGLSGGPEDEGDKTPGLALKLWDASNPEIGIGWNPWDQGDDDPLLATGVSIGLGPISGSWSLNQWPPQFDGFGADLGVFGVLIDFAEDIHHGQKPDLTSLKEEATISGELGTSVLIATNRKPK